MSSTPLPAALSLLEDERNHAADVAMVEALPHMNPAARSHAISLLAKRGYVPALASMIRRFPTYSSEVRELILARAGLLAPALRAAMTGGDLDGRLAAIRLIVESRATSLAYVLAEVLKARCVRTREQAALGLTTLVETVLHDRCNKEKKSAEATIPGNSRALDEVAEGVRLGVHAWETHCQLGLLEAACMLADRLMPVLRGKIEDGHSKIGVALNDLLVRTHDPRMAAFLWQSLGVASLRAAAIRAITRAVDPTFIEALLHEGWHLDDPEIRRGCRWIQNLHWLQDQRPEAETVEMERVFEKEAVNIVRLVGAMGGPPERKLELYRRFINSGNPSLRRETAWRLIDERGDGSDSLLNLIVLHSDDDIARAAAIELERRHRAAGIDDTSHAQRSVSTAAGGESSSLSESQLATIRKKLQAHHAIDRVRALSEVASQGLAQSLRDDIHRLAHDAEPIVRAAAIALLAHLPDGASVRMLRAAMDDPDPRVQANAIEGLEHLDVPDRALVTGRKLASPHPRVRANAIKSLLGLELPRAATALFDMLNSQSHADRISALWVAERMNLQSLLDRITTMSRYESDERVRQRAMRLLRGWTIQEADRAMAASNLASPFPSERSR